MGEIVLAVVKWTVRFAIIISLVFAFTVILNLSISMIGVSLNQSVIGDLFALLQIWLPFDLDVVTTWLVTATVLYVVYRTSIYAAAFLNKFVG